MLKNAFVIKYASHVGKGNMHPAILDKKNKKIVLWAIIFPRYPSKWMRETT